MNKSKQTTSHRYLMDPGPYAQHVLAYLESIEGVGYSPRYYDQRAGAARHFCRWLHVSGYGTNTRPDLLLREFADHDCWCAGYALPARKDPNTFWRARFFVRFLVETGVIAAAWSTKPPDPPEMTVYLDWLRQHRGLADSTLDFHRKTLRIILPRIGVDAGQYTVAALRSVIIEGDGPGRQVRSKAQALRSWLRYNIFLGRCSEALLQAIPSIPSALPGYLPRGLSTQQVEDLIASCDISTRMGRRDRAVILLLARLGLRAGDITGLTFSQLDWKRGRLRVKGKTDTEVVLPLPQEVGDAILDWLENARPSVSDPHVFLCCSPPWRRFSYPSAVSSIVQRSIDRAGLKDTPTRGAHLLRHSLARRMLDEGASLELIATVLRHKSIDTTAYYSKVDINTLRDVAQLWPDPRTAAPAVDSTVDVASLRKVAVPWPPKSVAGDTSNCRDDAVALEELAQPWPGETSC